MKVRTSETDPLRIVGERGDRGRLTKCQAAPRERTHTDVRAGPQRSTDSEASRAGRLKASRRT